MATYVDRDLSASLSGDLILSANGDLQLADTYESQKAAINFIVRTDRGEYRPDNRVGADIGSFIGEKHTREAAEAIENSVRQNITQFVMAREDVAVHVIPIAYDEAGIFIAIGGQYIDSDGNLLDVEPEMLTYRFPYSEPDPTPLV